MKLHKKTEKLLDAAFKTAFDCLPIPMLDIPKIFNEARKRVLAGEDALQVMHNLALGYK